MAEAALSEGLITPTTPQLCSGAFTIGGVTFHNVEAGVYSSMSLPTALADRATRGSTGSATTSSCAAARASRRGRRSSASAARRTRRARGVAGLVPTPAWLSKTDNQPWYEGQTINLSIGQGYLQATPLQMAVAYSALANGGTVVRPHVAQCRSCGASRCEMLEVPAGPQVEADGRQYAIRDGLYQAAHSPAGTSASLFANFPVPVAGKTGTAESGPGRSDHSWYASWAPANNPKIVVVVLVAHGGFGAASRRPRRARHLPVVLQAQELEAVAATTGWFERIRSRGSTRRLISASRSWAEAEKSRLHRRARLAEVRCSRDPSPTE